MDNAMAVGLPNPQHKWTTEDAEYRELTEQATRILGSAEKAQEWMETENELLRGYTPQDEYLKNGPEQIQTILGKAEYIVYS